MPGPVAGFSPGFAGPEPPFGVSPGGTEGAGSGVDHGVGGTLGVGTGLASGVTGGVGSGLGLAGGVGTGLGDGLGEGRGAQQSTS